MGCMYPKSANGCQQKRQQATHVLPSPHATKCKALREHPAPRRSEVLGSTAFQAVAASILANRRTSPRPLLARTSAGVHKQARTPNSDSQDARRNGLEGRAPQHPSVRQSSEQPRTQRASRPRGQASRLSYELPSLRHGPSPTKPHARSAALRSRSARQSPRLRPPLASVLCKPQTASSQPTTGRSRLRNAAHRRAWSHASAKRCGVGAPRSAWAAHAAGESPSRTGGSPILRAAGAATSLGRLK